MEPAQDVFTTESDVWGVFKKKKWRKDYYRQSLLLTIQNSGNGFPTG